MRSGQFTLGTVNSISSVRMPEGKRNGGPGRGSSAPKALAESKGWPLTIRGPTSTGNAEKTAGKSRGSTTHRPEGVANQSRPSLDFKVWGQPCLNTAGEDLSYSLIICRAGGASAPGCGIR